MQLKFYRPIVDAMKVLQAIFKITFSHENRQFRYANACSHFLTQNYLADKRKHNELRG